MTPPSFRQSQINIKIFAQTLTEFKLPTATYFGAGYDLQVGLGAAASFTEYDSSTETFRFQPKNESGTYAIQLILT